VFAGGQGGERAFAGVDRTIVLHQHRPAWPLARAAVPRDGRVAPDGR
jgi:hypothetical protein